MLPFHPFPNASESPRTRRALRNYALPCWLWQRVGMRLSWLELFPEEQWGPACLKHAKATASNPQKNWSWFTNFISRTGVESNNGPCLVKDFSRFSENHVHPRETSYLIRVEITNQSTPSMRQCTFEKTEKQLMNPRKMSQKETWIDDILMLHLYCVGRTTLGLKDPLCFGCEVLQSHLDLRRDEFQLDEARSWWLPDGFEEARIRRPRMAEFEGLWSPMIPSFWGS